MAQGLVEGLERGVGVAPDRHDQPEMGHRIDVARVALEHGLVRGDRLGDIAPRPGSRRAALQHAGQHLGRDRLARLDPGHGRHRADPARAGPGRGCGCREGSWSGPAAVKRPALRPITTPKTTRTRAPPTSAAGWRSRPRPAEGAGATRGRRLGREGTRARGHRARRGSPPPGPRSARAAPRSRHRTDAPPRGRRRAREGRDRRRSSPRRARGRRPPVRFPRRHYPRPGPSARGQSTKARAGTTTRAMAMAWAGLTGPSRRSHGRCGRASPRPRRAGGPPRRPVAGSSGARGPPARRGPRRAPRTARSRPAG